MQPPTIARWEAAQERSRLCELHRWLTWETLSGAGMAGAFILPASLVFSVIMLAAIAFTPYMLYRLYQLRWFGWLATFGLVVGPPCALWLTTSARGVTAILLWGGVLIFYFTYTWALRWQVEHRLEEMAWQQEFS
jgi:hypothetical protein